MSRKGLLLPKHEDFLAEVFDNLVKFKNPILESFDRTFFKLAIQALDNQGLDKIREDWKLDLILIIDQAMEFKVEEVRRLATDLLNKRIDIPSLDEETELVLFDSFTRFAVAVIIWYLEKVKNEKK